LFAIYDEKLTPGAKEENTRRVEKIHAANMTRIIEENKGNKGDAFNN
jgi:hypothetical protein